MLIGTVLSMLAAQMVAAKLNRFSRWEPRVVPLLPPSGVTGVASLKPSPGPSLFTMLITVVLAVRSEVSELLAPGAEPVTESPDEPPPAIKRGAALRIISLYW